jgi:thymidine phosphorylase
MDLQVTTGMLVEKNQPLFTLHADSSGELAYALKYLEHEPKIIEIK